MLDMGLRDLGSDFRDSGSRSSVCRVQDLGFRDSDLRIAGFRF